MHFRNFAIGAIMASALAVAGCGTTPGDRAVSGGLLGAGAGAAIGSVTGSAATGAVIGGVAGAAVGALTDPCDLDLGTPFWRSHGGREGYERRCGEHHHHHDHDE
jgi:osmotically inducible lipoprotein OsmB